jgi:hypothetical protein
LDETYERILKEIKKGVCGVHAVRKGWKQDR